MFGNLEPSNDYAETDARLSAMKDAWIAFARTGTPSLPDGSAWPRYADDAPRMTVISDDLIRNAPFVTTELTDILHSLRR